MKPSVVIALVFRFIAVLWVLMALISLGGPALAGIQNLFADATPDMLRAADYRPSSFLEGLAGAQVISGLVSLAGGVLLYIWSPSLGRLTARGLE